MPSPLEDGKIIECTHAVKVLGGFSLCDARKVVAFMQGIKNKMDPGPCQGCMHYGSVHGYVTCGALDTQLSNIICCPFELVKN